MGQKRLFCYSAAQILRDSRRLLLVAISITIAIAQDRGAVERKGRCRMEEMEKTTKFTLEIESADGIPPVVYVDPLGGLHFGRPGDHFRLNGSIVFGGITDVYIAGHRAPVTGGDVVSVTRDPPEFPDIDFTRLEPQ